MENRFQKCIHNFCKNGEDCCCFSNKFKHITCCDDEITVPFNKKFCPQSEKTEDINILENSLVSFSDKCFRQRELDIVLDVDELFEKLFEKWDEKDVVVSEKGQMSNHVDEAQSEQIWYAKEIEIEHVNDLEEEEAMAEPVLCSS